MTSWFADQLKSILSLFINDSQMTFIPGRDIEKISDKFMINNIQSQILYLEFTSILTLKKRKTSKYQTHFFNFGPFK